MAAPAASSLAQQQASHRPLKRILQPFSSAKLYHSLGYSKCLWVEKYNHIVLSENEDGIRKKPNDHVMAIVSWSRQIYIAIEVDVWRHALGVLFCCLSYLLYEIEIGEHNTGTVPKISFLVSSYEIE
jgi:hypothetical protein